MEKQTLQATVMEIKKRHAIIQDENGKQHLIPLREGMTVGAEIQLSGADLRKGSPLQDGLLIGAMILLIILGFILVQGFGGQEADELTPSQKVTAPTTTIPTPRPTLFQDDESGDELPAHSKEPGIQTNEAEDGADDFED